MLSLRILSGLLATYLVAAPCLVLDHDSGISEVSTISVAEVHDHSVDTQQHDADPSEDDEHCCEDLSSSIHAPLKQLPTSVAAIAVMPSFEIYVPYVHLDQRIALSRDGPLHEQANEFAKTIVIRS